MAFRFFLIPPHSAARAREPAFIDNSRHAHLNLRKTRSQCNEPESDNFPTILSVCGFLSVSHSGPCVSSFEPENLGSAAVGFFCCSFLNSAAQRH